MPIVLGKGTARRGTWCKAEALIKAGRAKNKDGVCLDHLLPQGKTQQLGAHPLVLKIRFHRQRRQMQAADRGAVIGIGKSNIGDDPIGVNSYPLMHYLAILVEIFNQLHFIIALGKRLPQQGGDLGVILGGKLTYLHRFPI